MSSRHAVFRRRITLAAILPLIAATFFVAVRPQPANADATAATGTATWGLRQSYRNYLTSPIAGGEIIASDGAEWLEGPGRAQGPFSWPVESASFDEESGTGSIGFSGTVFTGGHDYGDGYILELQLSNLQLDIDGDAATLYADLDFRPFIGADPNVPPPPEESEEGVAFASIDLGDQDLARDSDGAITITDAPTVGVTGAMESIGWDQFYSSEMPNPNLDTFSLTFTPGPDETPAFEATLGVSKTGGLDPDGETITVDGTGFDPNGHVGTRPPLAGKPSGVYVVFGDFDTDWKPSDGIGSGARRVISQYWALPEPSFSQMNPDGDNDDYILIDENGNFTAEFDVTDDGDAEGNLGIYTYPGSGATNADQELAQLLTFDDGTTPPTEPTTTTTQPTTTTTQPTPTTTEPVTSGDAVILGGELEWGVYQSFVKYVNGNIAKGTVTTADGASGAPHGPFLFPAVKDETIRITDPNLSIDFRGSVGFRGHVIDGTPALEMAFSNFKVEKTGSKGRLLADANVRPFEGMTEVAEPVLTEGAHVADLDFSKASLGRIGDGAGWLEVPAVVAKGAEGFFGNFYETGDPLDPVSIRLELSEIPGGLGNATAPPAQDGPTVSIDVTSVAPGGTIQVTASGFLPDEQIEVWLHSTPEFLETVRADATGAVQAAITIPLTATPGTHRLELRGISSELSASSPEFQVISAGPNGQGLPRTGSDTGPLVPMALSLLTAGAGIVFAARRRRLAPVTNR